MLRLAHKLFPSHRDQSIDVKNNFIGFNNIGITVIDVIVVFLLLILNIFQTFF